MIELNKETSKNLPVKYLPYQYKIAEYCYLTAFESVGKAKSLLELLSKKYKLVLVSNFYGNIETVLKDFGILKLFPDIIESAVVGIRKPDPAIFALGVEKCMCTPEEVIVIGDSYKKDIIPAESLGCRTVWIKGEGWDNSEDGISHQQIITDFMELKEILL